VKIPMIKNAGGGLCPADEMYLDKLMKLENGGLYEIELKKTNNPKLHRKLFAFFKFCFDHYSAEETDLGCADEVKQFNHFRKRLTILAGFFDEFLKKVLVFARLFLDPLAVIFKNGFIRIHK